MKIYASNAARIVQCSASLKKETDHPRPDSPHAEEGRNAHDEAERLIRDFLAGKDINNVHTTYNIGMYVEDVTNAIRVASHSSHVFGLESKKTIPYISENMVGKSDAFLYLPKEKTLILWELKYGRVPVEAYRNWQMLCYLFQFVEEYKIDKVQFRVIQPNSLGNKIGIWALDSPYFRTYAEELQRKCKMALGDNPTETTGKECTYCGGRLFCKSFHTVVETLYTVTSKVSDIALDSAELACKYVEVEKAAALLNSLKSAVEMEVTERLKKGENIPGWYLKPTPGRLVWKGSYDTVMEFGKLCKVDLQKKEVITPTQSRLPKEILDHVTERKVSLKLTQENLDFIKEITKC